LLDAGTFEKGEKMFVARPPTDARRHQLKQLLQINKTIDPRQPAADKNSSKTSKFAKKLFIIRR